MRIIILLLVLLPLLSKSQDTVHLKGNGTDETVTLQSAINKSSNLVILSGNYNIGKINLHSNLTIHGIGAKLHMIQGSYDNIMISLWQISNVRITGLEIALNGIQGNIWDGTSAIEMYGCSNIQIDSCYIHDNTYVAIRLTGNNNNIIILHNNIQNTDTGIHCNNKNTNVTIRYNYIQGGTSEGVTVYGYNNTSEPYLFTIDSNIITNKSSSFGINIPFAKQLIIAYNTITSCLGGIMLHDSVSTGTDTIYSSSIIVNSNLLSNNIYGIINISDSSTISNNIIQNTKWDGIQGGYVNHISNFVKIINNTITNVAYIGGGTAAINLQNITNCTVLNNIIKTSVFIRTINTPNIIVQNNL